jgi:uncharacterized protein (DUF779 family)
MSGQDPGTRVVATPAAEEAITGLLRGRGPVMFVQSGGCCGGSAPMCFPAGEFLTGPADLLLGEVEGCPFYIDADLYEAWGRPALLLDTEPGFPEGFSLAAGDGLHFVIRTRSGEPLSCPVR